MADTKVNLVWYGGTDGEGALKSDFLSSNVTMRKKYGGREENGAFPMEFLTASGSQCYHLSILGVCRKYEIPVHGLTVESVLPDTEEDTIDHSAVLYIKSDATEEQLEKAKRVFEQAGRACTVGKIMKRAGFEVNYYGEIKVVEDASEIDGFKEKNNIEITK